MSSLMSQRKSTTRTSITSKLHVNGTRATKFLAFQISQLMRCTPRNLVIVADVHTWHNLTFENCYQLQIFLAEKAKRGSSTSISLLMLKFLERWNRWRNGIIGGEIANMAPKKAKTAIIPIQIKGDYEF